MKEPVSVSVVLRNYLAPAHNAHFRRHAVICLQCNSGKIEKNNTRTLILEIGVFNGVPLLNEDFVPLVVSINLKEAAIPSLAPALRIIQSSHMGQAGETPSTVIRNNRFYNLLSFFTKAPVHLFNFNSLLYL